MTRKKQPELENFEGFLRALPKERYRYETWGVSPSEAIKTYRGLGYKLRPRSVILKVARAVLDRMGFSEKVKVSFAPKAMEKEQVEADAVLFAEMDTDTGEPTGKYLIRLHSTMCYLLDDEIAKIVEHELRHKAEVERGWAKKRGTVKPHPIARRGVNRKAVRKRRAYTPPTVSLAGIRG